jgi:hypothetical protein
VLDVQRRVVISADRRAREDRSKDIKAKAPMNFIMERILPSRNGGIWESQTSVSSPANNSPATPELLDD